MPLGYTDDMYFVALFSGEETQKFPKACVLWLVVCSFGVLCEYVVSFSVSTFAITMYTVSLLYNIEFLVSFFLR